MHGLFIISHTELDKYGDEYLAYDFISAASTQNAWFLAGARLADESFSCVSQNCFDDGLETFSVDIWTPEDCEFWGVFGSHCSDEWVDDFMVWAVQNRKAASHLHAMAEAQDPPCRALLNLAQFVSVVEQYKIEQSVLNKKGSPSLGKKKSL